MPTQCYECWYFQMFCKQCKQPNGYKRMSIYSVTVNYKSTYQYTTCCHLLLVDHQDNSSCHLSMTPDTYIHIPETDSCWKLENKYRENAAINQSIH